METLSRSKFENFDIVMSSVPKQMAQMTSLPSPSPEPSTPGNVRTKRKRIIDSDDDGDDIIEVTPTRELAREPKVPKTKRRRDIDSDDDIETESVALSQPRMEQIIRRPVTIAVAAVAGARKEQIVLENKKPTESPSASGHEDAQNDDDYFGRFFFKNCQTRCRGLINIDFVQPNAAWSLDFLERFF